MKELTRQELEVEIGESEADLLALKQAYDVIWKRCIETRDNPKSRLMQFHEWAGTHALMNSLDVFINNSSRVVDELKALREDAPVAPRLRIVRNDE